MMAWWSRSRPLRAIALLFTRYWGWCCTATAPAAMNWRRHDENYKAPNEEKKAKRPLVKDKAQVEAEVAQSAADEVAQVVAEKPPAPH